MHRNSTKTELEQGGKIVVVGTHGGERRCAVISALIKGMWINATCRMTGVAKQTALKLLEDMGCACAAYHNAHVRNLRARRVQADEIWSFVYGKDKNLTLGAS